MKELVVEKLARLRQEVDVIDGKIEKTRLEIQKHTIVESELVSEKKKNEQQHQIYQNLISEWESLQSPIPLKEEVAVKPINTRQGKTPKTGKPKNNTRVSSKFWDKLPKLLPRDSEEAMSLRQLCDHLKLQGVHVSEQAVYTQAIKLLKNGLAQKRKSGKRDLWYQQSNNEVKIKNAAN